jgi:hypothetical protein
MRSPDPQVAPPFEPRPEQTFFSDPALDRALGIVMALATEVYVLRDRLFALERQLGQNGSLDPARLGAAPTPEESAAAQADCDAFVAHLMTPVLGLQASKGVA